MRRGDLAKYLMLQQYPDVIALGVVPLHIQHARRQVAQIKAF